MICPSAARRAGVGTVAPLLVNPSDIEARFCTLLQSAPRAAVLRYLSSPPDQCFLSSRNWRHGLVFATSGMDPVEIVGGRMLRLRSLNSITAIIDAYRPVLLAGELPSASFAVAALRAVKFPTAADVAHHQAEYQFTENI